MKATRPGIRALNKPMLIVGLDRRLLGLAVIFGVIVGANGSRLAGLVLFLVLSVIGRQLTRRDPNIFPVLRQVLRQKGLYDPMKRIWFRLRIERGAA